MPSLTRKFIKGRPYYYVRHCQRIDGKPKIIKTTYLGPLDRILQAVEDAQLPPTPQKAEILNFGDVAALYDQADQLRLVELIDAQLPKRDQGLSTGQYLLLAAINRAASPTSKAQLAHWYRQTILPRLLPASSSQLSSQAFWNHMGQLQGINASLQKARRKLDELQAVLWRRQHGKVKGGKPPTVQSVTRQVEQILSGQFLKSLLHYELKPGSVPRLTYRTDTNAFSRLIKTHLGKTILFTDNNDWTNEEIVSGYRAQHHIESAFRDMKNPQFLGWSPMFHWTDSKIRVHACYCVLALTLTSLLRRTLHQKGLDLSMRRMYERLGEIKEVLVLYPRRPGEHKPRTASCFSTMDSEQEKLFAALNLSRYQAV